MWLRTPYIVTLTFRLFQLQSRRATPKQVNKGKRGPRFISYFCAKLGLNPMTWDRLAQRTGKYCSIRRMEYRMNTRISNWNMSQVH